MALAQHTHQLLLFDDPHSEYCAKVKVVLHHKGLQWQSLPVAHCGSSAGQAPTAGLQQHLAPPLGKIPALIVRPAPPAHAVQEAAQPDSPSSAEVVLYESEVINEWLEETFPDPPMLPQEPLLRAKARLTSRFHDLYLEPALRKLYPQVVPHTRSPEAVSAAGQEFVQHLRHLDQQLLPPGARLAVGNCLSLADCSYPGLLHYAGLLWPVLGLGQLDFVGLRLPRVSAWHAALCQEPAVVRVLEELAPAAQQWLDSKLGGS